jgi:hypothetical protein
MHLSAVFVIYIVLRRMHECFAVLDRCGSCHFVEVGIELLLVVDHVILLKFVIYIVLSAMD